MVEPPKLIPDILAAKGFAAPQKKWIAQVDQMLKAPKSVFPIKDHLLRFHKTCRDTLNGFTWNPRRPSIFCHS